MENKHREKTLSPQLEEKTQPLVSYIKLFFHSSLISDWDFLKNKNWLTSTLSINAIKYGLAFIINQLK